MSQMKTIKQSKVLREMYRLAGCKANDAVRLAFLGEDELGTLDTLDLSAVTEFKRNSNGSVELKFIDRMAALKWLMDHAEGDPRAERLYRALEKNGREIEEGGPGAARPAGEE